MKKYFGLLFFLVLSMFIYGHQVKAQVYLPIDTEFKDTLMDRNCSGIFEDVGSDNSGCPYIEFLFIQNIAGGQDGNFMPANFVTRAQLAHMIVHAYNLEIDNSGEK